MEERETEAYKIGAEVKLQRAKLKEELYKLRSVYEHECRTIALKLVDIECKCSYHFEWIDTNPYNEICRCIYCGADSPRTRNS